MCSEKKPLSVWLSCEYRPINAGAEKLLQKVEDQVGYRSAALEQIIANAVVNQKTKHDRRNGGYDQNHQPISRNSLIKAVDGLKSVNLLKRYKGKQGVEVGGFVATPLFQKLIYFHKPVFKRSPRTILFTRKEIMKKVDANGNLYHDFKSIEIIPDMKKGIKKIGGWLKEINTFMENHTLTLPEEIVEKYNCNRGQKDKELHIEYDLIFRLIFNRLSRYGGRVYAEHGSYQIIPSEFRKQLLFNGEAVAEYDFSASHIHLIYAHEGVKYTDLYKDGDPYYLEINGKQVDRNICKLIVLVALNSESKEATLAAYNKKVKDDTAPPCENLSEIYDCFMEKHKAVSKWFGSSKKTGLKLHKIEGAIMVRAMHSLMKKGIPSAPVHDSLIVPENNGRVAIEALIQAYRHTLNAKRLEVYEEPKIEGKDLIYDPENNGIYEPVPINKKQPKIVNLDTKKPTVFSDFSEVKNSLQVGGVRKISETAYSKQVEKKRRGEKGNKNSLQVGGVYKLSETAYRKHSENKYKRRNKVKYSLQVGEIYSTLSPSLSSLPLSSLPLSISISFFRYLSV